MKKGEVTTMLMLVGTESDEALRQNLTRSFLGNAQKVILARELSRRPRVLLAAQPTRGLDVGATQYVRQELVRQRDEGMAILLISTELEEVLSLSDRIVVLYEGRVVGERTIEEATVEELGLMMAGSVSPEA